MAEYQIFRWTNDENLTGYLRSGTAILPYNGFDLIVLPQSHQSASADNPPDMGVLVRSEDEDVEYWSPTMGALHS